MASTPPPISPDSANQFTAQPLGAGLPVAHDPPAGAQNGDAEAVQHRRQLSMPAVQATPGPAATFDMPNHLFAFGSVLQVQPQDSLTALRFRPGLKILMSLRRLHNLADPVIQDEALVLEHLS